jgi:antitoxin ParD1/3/4
MNVTLSPELEALVKEKVASGSYRDQDDVVARALKLLERQDKVDALNSALDEGEADLREGRSVIVRTKEELDALLRSL